IHVLEAKYGPKIDADIATPERQFEEVDYASEVTVSLSAVGGVGQEIEEFLEFFENGPSAFELEREHRLILSTTPHGVMEVDKVNALPGEEVKFTVKLDITELDDLDKVL